MSYWTKLENNSDDGEGMMAMCVCFANEGWSSKDVDTTVIFDIQENTPKTDWLVHDITTG
jgi:hypothetical protein